MTETQWLSQIRTAGGARAVVVRDASGARRLDAETSVYALARRAIAAGKSIADIIGTLGRGDPVDLDAVEREGRFLSPIDHPDPAHLLITGTGLTHLGSASTRAAMHAAAQTAGKTAGKTGADPAELTDSMRMFNMGLEGGRPAPGEIGVQPEWFFKGTGAMLTAPGAPLVMPDFSGDGGEEPEVAGIYVVGDDGAPYRIGFALGNEFSDHVTEKVNYLWLAHSKLRPASVGPEIRLGPLPAEVHGTSRILRGDSEVYSAGFSSGEAHMSHTIANLEHHHFKYPVFRQPGDVHVHLFGTATLSFAKGIRAEPGDVFEISADGFGRALRNPLAVEPAVYAAARSL